MDHIPDKQEIVITIQSNNRLIWYYIKFSLLLMTYFNISISKTSINIG